MTDRAWRIVTEFLLIPILFGALAWWSLCWLVFAALLDFTTVLHISLTVALLTIPGFGLPRYLKAKP